VAGCTTPAYEQPLTAEQVAEGLASLPPEEREAFETLIWAREVDQRPILAEFNTCVDRELAAGSAELSASIVASTAVDACFPIIERLVRGIAMRVPALMTGPTADHLNSWADGQAAEQRAELLATLTKRVEEARASAPSAN
jgi:hypothetical protein